ncbi:SMP-30/gluconolactonase/LRE family protein [Nostoc sp. NIES-2111]
MTLKFVSPAFEAAVDGGAVLEELCTGFGFSEGPIWHPRDGYLLFSDMPQDVRRRWSPSGGLKEVMRPANKCNGMTYDAALNLLVCEHVTSQVVREAPDGSRMVLASHYEGQELNSPNDICVRSDGSIYFSDPWYGRMPVFGLERPRVLGFQGVYRIPPSGQPLELLVERDLFGQPNGLCFDPAERFLYVNDTEQANVRRFLLQPDGRLGPFELFAEGLASDDLPGRPDGMKTDEAGNVWCSGPGGIWVYSPVGTLSGKVRTPEMVGNLAWGGPGFRTLFVCASSSVYTLQTKVSGHREPYMAA